MADFLVKRVVVATEHYTVSAKTAEQAEELVEAGIIDPEAIFEESTQVVSVEPYIDPFGDDEED